MQGAAAPVIFTDFDRNTVTVASIPAIDLWTRDRPLVRALIAFFREPPNRARPQRRAGTRRRDSRQKPSRDGDAEVQSARLLGVATLADSRRQIPPRFAAIGCPRSSLKNRRVRPLQREANNEPLNVSTWNRQRVAPIARENPELPASAAIAKWRPGDKVNRANWNDPNRAICDKARD